MARPLRIEYPNAVYHVTSRGNARNRIFLGDQDRENFLFVLEAVVKRYNWLCHAYCLMDNHYHLMIETPDANLSRGMRQLNGVYTQKYNWWHSKTGHIFQGRYKSILVDKENYLLELCRYVVLNPVRANMVEKPEEWKWSSYGATAGLKNVPNYLTVDWILGLFSNNKAEAQKRYRKFVREGIHTGSPWDDLQGQILLGEEEFIEKYKDLLSDKEQIKEIPRPQRYVSRPRLSKLLSKEDKTARRNRGIHSAHVKYGYTLKEIADHLKIHYTTVSKVIKGLEEK
ncbi:MAG: transposase [Nitrospirae bacterium]|nr:transposase [Nitrospirota bacterium]MCL5236524.1 transposase [Nitrospirota bacterium]